MKKILLILPDMEDTTMAGLTAVRDSLPLETFEKIRSVTEICTSNGINEVLKNVQKSKPSVIFIKVLEQKMTVREDVLSYTIKELDAALKKERIDCRKILFGSAPLPSRGGYQFFKHDELIDFLKRTFN